MCCQVNVSMAHRIALLSGEYIVVSMAHRADLLSGNVAMAHRADLLSGECINGSQSCFIVRGIYRCINDTQS